MNRAVRSAAEIFPWLLFAALIGVFSSWPPFRPIEDGEVLVRVSLVHAAQRKQPCRERTPQELAKLAPNMRAAQVCPRERADLVVEIAFDGTLAVQRTLAASGWQRDGNAALYQRFTVPAGTHRVVARLRDRTDGDFNYVREATLDLKPGAALVIDFNGEKGGFLFRA